MANGKAGEKESYVLLRGNRRKHLRKQLLVLKIKGEGSRGKTNDFGSSVKSRLRKATGGLGGARGTCGDGAVPPAT
jgi:hypothetical protein